MKKNKKKTIIYFMYMIFILISTFKYFISNNIETKNISFFTSPITVIFWIASVITILLATVVFPRRKIYAISISIIFIISISFLNTNILSALYVLLFWFFVSYSITPVFYKKSMVLLFITIILLSYTLSLFNNYMNFDDRYGYTPTFGFENQNSFPQLLIILYILLSENIKKSFIFSIAFLLIGYLININSRIFYLMLILSPLIVYLCQNLYFAQKSYITPLALFFFSIYSSYMLYTNEYLINLNVLLSNRFGFSHIYLENIMSIKTLLFGVNDASLSTIPIPIDMSFIAMLVNNGLIVSLIYIFIYSISMKKMYIEKDYNALSISILMMLYATFENVFINILLNPSIYYAVYYLTYSKIRSLASTNIK